MTEQALNMHRSAAERSVRSNNLEIPFGKEEEPFW